ncbi:MAG: phosphoglycerate kinase [Chitinophagaceae bacterium]
MGVDIGPKTIAKYTSLLSGAKHGGVERPDGRLRDSGVRNRHQRASPSAVASVYGTTIIGGGDSIAAIKKAGMADRITHISTGGGASLEFLGGCTLPGRRGAQGQITVRSDWWGR